MRHAWVPEGAIKDQHLSDGDLRVFSYLLTFANEDGFCVYGRVTASTIAKALGKARTTIIFHLNRLIELGYVAKSPTWRADGGSGPNEYWVARDGITPVSTGLTPPCQSSGHPRVNKLSTGGVNKLSTPINNRLIEQKKTPSHTHARVGSFLVDEDEENDASQGDDADRRRQPGLLLPIAGTLAGDADQQRRGERLPEDFVVPPPWIAEAAAVREQLHLRPANLQLEAVKFASHWISEEGDTAVKRDWLRAWVKWCLNPIVKAIDADTKPRGQEDRNKAGSMIETALNYVEKQI
jgi:hypothetical protein